METGTVTSLQTRNLQRMLTAKRSSSLFKYINAHALLSQCLYCQWESSFGIVTAATFLGLLHTKPHDPSGASMSMKVSNLFRSKVENCCTQKAYKNQKSKR